MAFVPNTDVCTRLSTWDPPLSEKLTLTFGCRRYVWRAALRQVHAWVFNVNIQLGKTGCLHIRKLALLESSASYPCLLQIQRCYAHTVAH